MKPHKFSDHKAADKNHAPPRNPGRDYHSASQKVVRDVKEGAKSDHKGKSDK